MLLDEFFNLPQVFEKTEPVEYIATVRSTDEYPEFSVKAKTAVDAKSQVLALAQKKGIQTPVVLVRKVFPK